MSAAPILSSTIPTIISSWFCPYAQRVLIAANAKKLATDFQVHQVGFDELFTRKPQWLLDLNPAGLVPCIAWQTDSSSSNSSSAQSVPAAAAAATAAVTRSGGIVSIMESLICNEYLEERYPTPPLLPSDPVGRAAARLLIQRVDNAFVSAFKQVLVQTRAPESEQVAAAAGLDAELTWLLQNMHSEGPLSLSGELSLVDCAIAPHLLRLYILRHYAGYRYRGPEGERLRRYKRALHHHPAVASTCVHPEGLNYQEELLKVYARYGVSLLLNHQAPLW